MVGQAQPVNKETIMETKRNLSKSEVKRLQSQLEGQPEAIRLRELLTIHVQEKLSVDKKGLELNEGYQFEVNGALPELADGIAKLAIEMEKAGFGDKSGDYFLALVNEYYKRLKAEQPSSTDVK